jgi:beta-galactosidase
MPKLFHGACYYPELWPEADIDRDIAGIKAAGLNVVRLGDFAWSHLEPVEGRISTAFFLRVMDKLHAAGLNVVFCTPTAAAPVWLTHGHPERCFVDAEGRVMAHGARQHVSYEHPDVRAACFRIVEELGRSLGKHPALVGWQIDNEFKCHVGEDFSPAAVAHWHRWLEKRFGTIERLNEAWGTDIWATRYQSFAQVPAPVRTPFLHSASLSTAYRMFSRESIAAFMDDQSAILRQHSSAPITHNFAPGFSVNLERMTTGLDFVSFDDYPAAASWDTVVFDNDLFRAAKPGRAHWFMETSVGYNGWLGNHEPVHPPGFLVAEAVASYALGAGAFCYWLWKQQRTGAELPHSAIMTAWDKPSLGYASVTAVNEARRQLEPLLTASQPAPVAAAVTWSDLGRAMLQTEPVGANRTHEVDYNRTVGLWHRLLVDAGVPRDIRFEGAALDGLRLLITPAMPYASPAFLARVEQFVRGGGIWICAPITGTRAAEHTLPTDAALGAIEALAGVETVFSFPITGTGATGEAFNCAAPLAGWCSALRPASADTKVVGTLQSALTPGLALLTERSLGQGAVVVLGTMPEGEYGRALLAKLVAHYAARAGIAPLTASPGTIVCPRVRADGSTFWIAVNLNGQGGEVHLPRAATDALSGAALAAGPLKLGRYEWRALAR